MNAKDIIGASENLRIDLSEAEVEALTRELRQICEHMNNLRYFDADDYDIAAGEGAQLREDKAGKSIEKSSLFKQAPGIHNECYLVPLAVGGGESDK